MRRRLISAAVAAISLAGLAFTSPASAASLPDRMYGCARGDFCMYSTEVISAATKISIGRGENWSSLASDSPYKGVRSFFNYGWPDTYDRVAVSFLLPNQGGYSFRCVPRAEEGNLPLGHKTVSVPVTVIHIEWVKAETCTGP
ncbi:hypothetical protein ABZ815_52615 [Nonomuraea sp. NPDC047529]|uniref:hypothetical protein n=1 Tax=Nonomuraea sp. NPDC047529 TaxID=3155623 RepID=UPI0033CE4485